MEWPTNTDIAQFLLIFFTLAAVAFGLAILLLVWIIWQIKRVDLPPDADFLTALRATPLVVVLFLDLLDFSLDIFSAPIAWVLLSYLGLRPLRGVTVAEQLIPGTQLLPTMTAAWIFARLTQESGNEKIP
jgi:hypothetical protein